MEPGLGEGIVSEHLGLSANDLHGFTRQRVCTGLVHCLLGSSQKRGSWGADPELTKMALGRWNGVKETELVHDADRYQLDMVRLTTAWVLKPVFFREAALCSTLKLSRVRGNRLHWAYLYPPS